MDILVMLGIAVGLSMDCLAVSLGCGMRLGCPDNRQTLRTALAFGAAQAIMPVIGWAAGHSVVGYIKDYDHWLAFALLSFVGGKMIREYFEKECAEEEACDPTKGRELLVLSIATSIDALAVGLSLAFLDAGIALPAVIIGVTCFVITVAGMRLGSKASELFGRRMELVGGLVLIAIGVKILAEHLAG